MPSMFSCKDSLHDLILHVSVVPLNVTLNVGKSMISFNGTIHAPYKKGSLRLEDHGIILWDDCSFECANNSLDCCFDQKTEQSYVACMALKKQRNLIVTAETVSAVTATLTITISIFVMFVATAFCWILKRHNITTNAVCLLQFC